jgi:hypothetical protein
VVGTPIHQHSKEGEEEEGVMLFNASSFALQIRELISQLESQNRDQAELYAGDGAEFLRTSLNKRPREMGAERLRETLLAYSQVLDSLARDDFRRALVAGRNALDIWEEKSPQKEGE